jgi:NTE family protein
MATSPCNPEVALVLAGGGARGAYEVGALSELLPYLERRGERPGIIVGTSIGALNGTFLAATAHESARASIDKGARLWRTITYREICDPLASLGELVRVFMYTAELLGVPRAAVDSLLDNSPMEGTVADRIDFDRIGENVEAGRLASIAVVATAYATGDSVVFHHSHDGVRPPYDDKRAIRYAATPLDAVHVRASAAIPVFFPAVYVDGPAAGWYGDGGTRLNTPIKPALALGAKKVVVAGLNSTVMPEPSPERPDVLDGAAQFVQPLLADQLLQDVATLATRNRLAREYGSDDGVVPYILVAPRDRLAIGELASDVYRDHLAALRDVVTPGSRDLAWLGRVLCADRNPIRGDLLSFLLFHSEFAGRLIRRGREDAKRFIREVGDGDPWHPPDSPAPLRARTTPAPAPA